MAAAASLAGAGRAEAQTVWTNPAGGDWYTPGNWSAGTPTSATDVSFTFSGAYSVFVNGPGAAVRTMRFLSGSVDIGSPLVPVGTNGFTGYPINVSLSVIVGTGATLRVYAPATLNLGTDLIVNGTVSQTGIVSARDYYLQSATGATHVVANNQLRASGIMAVGMNHLGEAGRGTLTFTGGASSAGNLWLASGNASASASMSVGGGPATAAFSTTNAYVGGDNINSHGSATLAVGPGGTFTATGTTKVWNNASVINLSGGTLRTGSLDLGGFSSRLNWTGGTLAITGLAGATVAASGVNALGTTLTLEAGKSLAVTDTLSVPSGGNVAIAGGSLNVRSLSAANAASFTFTGGDLTVAGGTFTPRQQDVFYDYGSGITTYTGSMSISGVAGTLNRPLLTLSGGATTAMMNTTGDSSIFIGHSGGLGAATVTGSGSRLATPATKGILAVGIAGKVTSGTYYPGDGTLALSGGGQASSFSVTYVGVQGGKGVATVDGSGSALVAPSGSLYVGAYRYESGTSSFAGDGTLTLSNGGQAISAVNTFIGHLGGKGVANVGKADGSDTGGTRLSSPNLYIGHDNSGFADSSGTLNVYPGGTVDVSATLFASLNTSAPASTRINLAGGTIRTAKLELGRDAARLNWTAGTLWFTGGAVNVSSDPNASSLSAIGSRTLTAGMTLRTSAGPGWTVYVGQYNGGSGTLTLAEAGARVESGWDVVMGEGTGAVGTLTVTGGVVATTGVYAGSVGGRGVINVNGPAAEIRTSYMYVAYAGGATSGTVNISNGLVEAPSFTSVAGTGSVINLSGGTLRTGRLDLGGVPTRLNWTGGTFQLTNSGLAVATAGSGAVLGGSLTIDSQKTLIVSGGMPIADIGTGTLTINGGSVTAGGAMTLFTGATVNLSAGTLRVPSIARPGPGAFNWTGGTLAITGSNANLSATRFTVGSWLGNDTTVGAGKALLVTQFLGIGNTAGSTTLSVIDGGTVTAADTDIAANTAGMGTGSGVLTVSSGTGTPSTYSVAGRLAIGGDGSTPGGTGTVNIGQGGWVQAGGITSVNTSASRVNLSGGTLKAGALELFANPSRLNWTGGTLELSGSRANVGTDPLVGELGTSGASRIGSRTLDADMTLRTTAGNAIYVGQYNNGVGSLTLAEAGARVESGWDIVLGDGGGARGTLTVTGGLVVSGNSIYAGNSGGRGYVNINGPAANVQVANVLLGVSGGSTNGRMDLSSGTVSVTGAVRTYSPSSTLNVTGGSLTTNTLDLASGGAFTFTGGTVTVSEGVYSPKVGDIYNDDNGIVFVNTGVVISGIGGAASGPTLVLQNGADLGPGISNVMIGNSSGTGMVSVTGTGSTLLIDANRQMYVGAFRATQGGTSYPGLGTLSISDGGTVAAGYVKIGSRGGKGTIEVDGASASLRGTTAVDSYLDVGLDRYVLGTTVNEGGDGMLWVRNGGLVDGWSGVSIGAVGGSGSALVDGVGSRLTSRVLQVGASYYNSGTQSYRGVGSVMITNGGAVTTSLQASIGSLGGMGSVSVVGDGSTLSVASNLNVGAFANGTTLRGQGFLAVSAAASAVAGTAVVGLSGGVGEANIDGPNSRLSASVLTIGSSRTGSGASGIAGVGALNLSNGAAAVVTTTAYVGLQGGSGTVTGDGPATTLSASAVYVGSGRFGSGTSSFAGVGTVTLSNGAALAATVTLVGDSGGSGTLLVASGGTVSVVGTIVIGSNSGTGVASVSGPGSSIATVSGGFSIGSGNSGTGGSSFPGEGTLTVTDGGNVTSAGAVLVGFNGGRGALTLGQAGVSELNPTRLTAPSVSLSQAAGAFAGAGGTLTINPGAVLEVAGSLSAGTTSDATQRINLAGGGIIASSIDLQSASLLNWTAGEIILNGGPITAGITLPHNAYLGGSGTVQGPIAVGPDANATINANYGPISNTAAFSLPGSSSLRLLGSTFRLGGNAPGSTLFGTLITSAATTLTFDTPDGLAAAGGTIFLQGGTLQLAPGNAAGLLSSASASTAIFGPGNLAASINFGGSSASIYSNPGTLNITAPIGDGGNIYSSVGGNLNLTGGNGAYGPVSRLSANGTVSISGSPFAAASVTSALNGSLVAASATAGSTSGTAALNTSLLIVREGSATFSGMLSAVGAGQPLRLSFGQITTHNLALQDRSQFLWTSGFLTLTGGTSSTGLDLPASSTLNGPAALTGYGTINGSLRVLSGTATVAASGGVSTPSTFTLAGAVEVSSSATLLLSSGRIAYSGVDAGSTSFSGTLRVVSGATFSNLAPGGMPASPSTHLNLAGGTLDSATPLIAAVPVPTNVLISGNGILAANIDLRETVTVLSEGGTLNVTRPLHNGGTVAASGGSTLRLRGSNDGLTPVGLLSVAGTVRVEANFSVAETSLSPGGSITVRNASLTTGSLAAPVSASGGLTSAGSFGAVFITGNVSSTFGAPVSAAAFSPLIVTLTPSFTATQTFSGGVSLAASFRAEGGHLVLARPVVPLASVPVSIVAGLGTRVTLAPTSYVNPAVRVLAAANLGVEGRLDLGAASALLPAGVLDAASLTIGNDEGPLGSRLYSGRVDLADHALRVRQGETAEIHDAVRAWWNGGTRDGAGLGSSLAVNSLTLAVFSNDSGAVGLPFYLSYAGVALSPTDTLVRLTYLGDTNIDGKLDGFDLANLIEGYSLGLSGWQNGDVNYDGTVDGQDLALFRAAFDAGLPPLGFPLGGSGGGGAIPEPSGLCLIAAAAGLLGRRRR